MHKDSFNWVDRLVAIGMFLLILVGYVYRSGQIVQKLDDLGDRVTRIESKVFHER
jgi:type II secretory pathway component PulL